MNRLSFLAITFIVLSGCNVSPLSPSNRPTIRNNGDVGDIKNNQQGIMLELANLKSRMDVMARDIESMQSGLINHNNKNSGVQIFHGDGGLIAGLMCMALLGFMAINYRIKSERYKKTARLLGEQINMNDPEVKEKILIGAMRQKVEKETLSMLRSQPSR